MYSFVSFLSHTAIKVQNMTLAALHTSVGLFEHVDRETIRSPVLSLFSPQIVENCVCTLRNLSYRLELEMPPSRLMGNQELDTLLGNDPSSKQMDFICWGLRKKKKKRSWQDQQASLVLCSRYRIFSITLSAIQAAVLH